LPGPAKWVVDAGYAHLLAAGLPRTDSEAWELVRGELVADWIAEHPGTRPEAWWSHEATEPLRVIRGEQHPEDGYAPFDHLPPGGYSEAWGRDTWPHVLAELQVRERELRTTGAPLGTPGGRSYHFGMAATIKGGPRPGGWPCYEPEHRYLELLDLLTAEERADFDDLDRAHRFTEYAQARSWAYTAGQHGGVNEAGRKHAAETAATLARLTADLERRGELKAATAAAMASPHRLWNDAGGYETRAPDPDGNGDVAAAENDPTM